MSNVVIQPLLQPHVTMKTLITVFWLCDLCVRRRGRTEPEDHPECWLQCALPQPRQQPLTDGRLRQSLTSWCCLLLHGKANFSYFVFFSIYFYFSHLTLCRVRNHCALVSCLRFNTIAQWKIPNVKGPKWRTHVILVPRCSCLNNALLGS